MPGRRIRRLILGAAAAAVLLAACGGTPTGTAPAEPARGGAEQSPPSRAVPPSDRKSARAAEQRTRPAVSDGRPARAALTIPQLGIRGLVVVPYRGRTDDAPGTAIQNRGLAASPFGPHGGVGPGGVGNYQVTAHRLSSTQAFRYLPRLARGDEVVVEAPGTRYIYRIITTRETSFRSKRSLREQRAAVPGRPGVRPSRAMITLSTCATVEDHAAGNYWADEFDNPEHRIDKVGVLVRTRPT